MGTCIFWAQSRGKSPSVCSCEMLRKKESYYSGQSSGVPCKKFNETHAYVLCLVLLPKDRPGGLVLDSALSVSGLVIGLKELPGTFSGSSLSANKESIFT